MIIDIHSHLGDILHPNGGDVIFREGIPEFTGTDTIAFAAENLYRIPEELADISDDERLRLLGESSQIRSATASLENMGKSLEDTGIVKTACMPIPPYVCFEDLNKVAKQDDRIIPFTGLDFTRPEKIAQDLERDVKNGAKGLKIHPIIQKTPANSEIIVTAVAAFSSYGLPLLLHSGFSSYYVNEEQTTHQTIEHGAISPLEKLVCRFDSVPFIIGHAGLFEVEEVISRLSPLKNTWVDISFQSPESIQALICAFGPERVMYASDWPWGDRVTPIKAVKAACNGDAGLEHLIFYENAVQLLALDT
jgi:uncharacterized protein